MGVLHMRQRTSDPDSFTWFFTREYPGVVRLLSVVLHDRSAAEDVAQEAFVRLYRRWDKVSRYDRPEAWVRRVALHCAFSWRRRELDRREREERAVDLREDLTAAAVDHDEVIRAVRALAPRDRALIALYHLEDRPLGEVAGLLGISQGAAKVALHRARRRLGVLLTDREVAG